MISNMMYVFAIILLVFLYVHGTAVAQTSTSTYYDKNTCVPGPHEIPNPSPEPDAQSPDIWHYQIRTTVVGQVINDDNDSASVDSGGMVLLEVHRAWAPLGADRFYSLVQDNYYACAAFFRIVPNFICQWGIASNPTETNKWNTNIPDDPVVEGISNTVGMVSFAMAGPNTRTTQIFVNTADNSPLDSQGFTPFAKVIQGMDVFVSGTMSIPSPVPDQFTYESKGNPWILQNYPTIDIIKGVEGVSSPNIFLSLNETSTETTANITTESPTSTTSNATTETETSFNETVAPSTDGSSLNETTAPSTEVSLNETAITDITDTDTDTDTSIDTDSSTSPATNKVASLNTNTASSTGTSTGIVVSTTIFCCAIVTTLIISFSTIM